MANDQGFSTSHLDSLNTFANSSLSFKSDIVLAQETLTSNNNPKLTLTITQKSVRMPFLAGDAARIAALIAELPLYNARIVAANVSSVTDVESWWSHEELTLPTWFGAATEAMLIPVSSAVVERVTQLTTQLDAFFLLTNALIVGIFNFEAFDR